MYLDVHIYINHVLMSSF